MSFLVRALLCVVCVTLAISIYSCGGGSTTTPVADCLGEATPVVETTTATWPAGLPVDALQPWETLEADGKVSAGLNADGEFLAGVEYHRSCGTGITDTDETVRIESGEPGNRLVAWTMYRVVMGGEQPGVVAADVNPGEMSDGGLSEYYIGLSDYGDGCWNWHGPFTDNHVRISTGAAVADGRDYLSELGNHFVCIVAFDGAVVDVVGVATNTSDATDTEAPPAPLGLYITPANGALDVQWDDVIAGDLAGYRLYWSEADFTTVDEAGVNCVDYLIGQPDHLLTDLPATTIRVRVSAVDISGNESALSDQTSVLVYEGTGPELRLGVSAASGMINDTVTLTATGATNYAWDLDGDGTYEVTGDTTGVQTADTGHTGIIRPSVRGTTDDESCVACGAVSLVIASNSRPVASALATPATGTAPLLCTLTGNGLDDDGTLASWSWDFDGDGTYDQTDTSDPGPVEHTYTAAGMYNAKFRVEDDLGSWDVDTVSIFVSEPLTVNHPPEADLAIGTGEESGDAPHSVHFDASGSSDPDGAEDIVRYWWDLDGDGMYEGATDTAGYNYTYQSPGVYAAKVKVEDADGDSATDSVEITVSVPGNADPVADLAPATDSGDAPYTVSFDASGSTDSDGSIVLYEWDFDGNGAYDSYGTDPTIDHTYGAGSYTAKLRVTDDAGAQDTTTAMIDVNALPVAILQCSPASGAGPLEVDFVATGSYDPDGSIADYEWDFDGDGVYNETGAEADSRGDPTPSVQTYEANPPVEVSLRVTDNDGATDTEGFTITVHGWIEPTGIASSESNCYYLSLQIVDGNPAISYQTDAVLKYIRATDAGGTAWGTPVVADGNAVTGLQSSMAVVAGNPAISYWDIETYNLKYVRATDATGSSWDTPVYPTSGGSNGSNSSLAVVDGNPAIGFRGDGSNSLKYIRAADATGSTWGTVTVVDTDGNVGEYTSLVVVDGNPAISYYDYTNGYLKYVRATDAQGTAWGTPLAVDTTGDVGEDTSLAVVDGNPAISYYDVSNSDLKYVRATDAQGTAWDTPVAVDTAGEVGGCTSLGTVDGNPAISYYDYTNGYLKYVRATDAQGTAWDTPVAIVTDGSVGADVSMAILDGKPAIAYIKNPNRKLRFIRSY